ncbi:dihydrofolate reductase [Parastagonospora nodorum]|uniref:Dihydrofolate reductase n=2 Tax=Phaeosphaeria nodorum (strain SN15 / ATCC MYA-4574 / FGSC 10173) TaxID=321614 RepID=A0A7U2I6U0_PHANO|nr:dihydrofolate reductase [Parastagonospora nodorum]QRD03995.1 dihydrofolate reductase [Parastagonospora nodorum SN15]KAH3924248.1 dihydrofolate reductase [Parastagonospora nodorum]KAH3961619.1 dihydrofolate reductase [Parastagonospora nodorum]KAH3993524.1 dihydrofolate reductase [Parastagonospora nodorum]
MSESSQATAQNQSSTPAASDASTMPKSPSLTLILAATPSLGIGKGGTLPWPQLKKEMGYFARVTKRVSSPQSTGTRKVNAVLMGRKTWDSIPPKFRPLKDRLNIVITRKADEFEKTLDKKSDVEGPMVASGIVDALAQLEGKAEEVDRVYVIGGASVYQTALELPQTRYVLLTKIRKEFECDTFFSVDLEESAVWRRAGREELQEFTGEEVKEKVIEEHGVEFEFCLYERV